jgi:glycosyltransferase involved in cell wall biosynthesis
MDYPKLLIGISMTNHKNFNTVDSIEISVILPIYNNAKSLPALLSRLTHVLAEITNNYEILCINDDSPDDSDAVLQQLSTLYSQLVVIALPYNVGQMEAIRTGIKHSTGKKILVMDADLQDSPEAILLLHNALIEKNLDAIFAAHTGVYQKRLRMLSSRCYKWLLQKITGLPKGAGSFVLFTRDIANKIIAHKTNRFYLSGLICLSANSIDSIIIPRNSRPEGQSAYSSAMRLQVALSYLQCLLELKLSCFKKNIL